MTAILKRELRALLHTFRGWGFLALLFLGAGLGTYLNIVRTGSAFFTAALPFASYAMAPGAILLSCTAFTAETSHGTERVLFALPVSSLSVLLGKLLARVLWVLVGCALVCVYPVVLCFVGENVSFAENLLPVVTLAAMGLMFVSISLACSACSANTGTALAMSVVLALAVFFVPNLLAAKNIPLGGLAAMFPNNAYTLALSGIFDARPAIGYLVVSLAMDVIAFMGVLGRRHGSRRIKK